MRRIKVAIVVVGAALFAAACGGKIEEEQGSVPPVVRDGPGPERRPTPAQLEEGRDSEDPRRTSPCPEQPPSSDHWCPQPYARCTYPDTCSQRPKTTDAAVFECRGSRWTKLGVDYDVACPPEPPTNGAACEAACRYPPSCSYELPCGAVHARCEPRSSTWYVSRAPSCSSDGGPSDAGPSDGGPSDADVP